MPADLHPTKARIALLWAVYDREVDRYDWGDGYEPSFWQKGLDGRGLKVTDRINQMRIAGWVTFPGYPGEGPRVCKWELTEAGRRVLEANPHG